ncbi:MAG: BON domain-containing protein [Sulfuritalea sp.]|nr:BON domain-containing protein [Sulfuritalea sp.]
MKLVFRPLALALLTVGAATQLTACFPLAVGGAVMTGMVATDRRTSGTVVEDQAIEFKAGSRIRDSLGDRAHINITSFNRQVLITGEAPNAQDKALVSQIVRNVENVESTVDEVAIMGNSNFSERSNDLIITGRIKASLLDSKDIFGTAFKVTTERGVAFLMGRVTERESKRATEAASVVPGVKKVVRVLEIISEDELARSQKAAPKK